MWGYFHKCVLFVLLWGYFEKNVFYFCKSIKKIMLFKMVKLPFSCVVSAAISLCSSWSTFSLLSPSAVSDTDTAPVALKGLSHLTSSGTGGGPVSVSCQGGSSQHSEHSAALSCPAGLSWDKNMFLTILHWGLHSLCSLSESSHSSIASHVIVRWQHKHSTQFVSKLLMNPCQIKYSGFIVTYCSMSRGIPPPRSMMNYFDP